MDELRSWWEVPSIAHFCSLFRSAFDLSDFDIEDLEEALLESQGEDGSEFLNELVCKLLNGCYCRKDITILTYDLYVKDVIQYKWKGTGNPIAEKSLFKELTLREKVDLIHSICEYRLDAEDVPDLLKAFEGDNMRLEPLGKDKDGATYWYFYGSRLYKEDPPPKKEISKEEKSPWSLRPCDFTHNPFPDSKILDWPKLEEVADEKLKQQERQRKRELEKKRREEKKQKKIEKQKLKSIEKAKKITKVSKTVKEDEDEANIRRSGRLRIKKEMKKYESETSVSSSEEETTESSSTEGEEEEEVEETEPKKSTKNTKKTPAKKPPAKKTPAKKTPAKQQTNNNTPNTTQRQSARKRSRASSRTPRNTSVEDIPDIDGVVRRSGRLRNRKQSVTPLVKYDSDTEEDIKDDIDSGNESGTTDDDDDTKSETSKMSVKSSVSKSSQQTPVSKKITLPRASANIEKHSTEEDNEDNAGDDNAEKEKDPDEENNEGDKGESQDDKMLEADSEETVQNVSESITDKKGCESEKRALNQEDKHDERGPNENQCDDHSSESPSEVLENENRTVEQEITTKNNSKESEMQVDVTNETVSDINTATSSKAVSETHLDVDVGDAGNNLEVLDKSQDGCMEEAMEGKDLNENTNNCHNISFDKSETKIIDQNHSNLETGLKTDLTESFVINECTRKDTCLISERSEKISDMEIDPVSVKLETLDNTAVDNDKQDLEAVHVKEENPATEQEESKDHENESTQDMAVDKDEPDIKCEDNVHEAMEQSKTETVEKEEILGEVKEFVNVDEVEKEDNEEKLEDVKEEKEENEDQDEDNIDELKEKEASGPKTTLGTQKQFGSVNPVPPTPSKSDTRWHLICSTLDDWVNLAEWFSNSQVRCEKMLVKLIKDDFLPVLPEIIEAREAERRKRLQELELRRSNRITQKMKEKMEQEKILAEALILEEKEKLRAEEERRLKEEQQKLEDENKLREERLKAREERAKRLSMREERARLLAEGKEIPPELLYTATNKYNDDYDSDDSRNDLKSDEDYHNLTRVIDAMKIHKDCWPFLDPVTDEVAPGYSDSIKRPMDLTTIEEKVKKKEYKSTQHFLSDFRLMFNNCKRFNGPESEFTECAKSMEQVLKKYKKRFLMDEPGENSYYRDRDFAPHVKGAKTGDKKYRPRRAASSKAMETVQKALNSSEEDEDDEDEDEEELEPMTKRKKTTEFPAKVASHQSLLLQEMIAMKRQREKNLAASALENHKVITRGPERIRIQNPQGGVTIMSKDQLPPKGLLQLAATREIKRKVSPNLNAMVDMSKKDPSLSITANAAPSPRSLHSGKTIRIVAPPAQTVIGGNVVKNTAETVKVSADGYLIIGGKNSGIKISENTKIVIQPPGKPPPQTPPAQGTELVVKKIPTPTGMKELPASSSSGLRPINSTGFGASVVRSETPRAPSILSASYTPAAIRSPQGSHQILNRGLNSSSGIVTQTGVTLQTKPLNQVMVNQKQKMILHRQLQQQQQNGMGSQSTPPKIIKLATQIPVSTQSSHMSIEDRLRDSTIDQVSENVVKSVNIAGDILDSYYSVFNSAKTTTSVTVPVLNQVVNQQVVNTLNQPVNTLNQPVNTVNHPVNTMSQPVNIVNQPMNIVNQPVNIVNQPVNIVNQPVISLNQLVKTPNQPVKIVNQTVNTVNQSVNSITTHEIATRGPSSNPILTSQLSKSNLPAQSVPNISVTYTPSKTVRFPSQNQPVVSPDIKSLLLKTVVSNQTKAISPTVIQAKPGIGSISQVPSQTFMNVNTQPTVQANTNTPQGLIVQQLTGVNQPTQNNVTINPRGGIQGAFNINEQNQVSANEQNPGLNIVQQSNQNVNASETNVSKTSVNVSPIEALLTANLASNVTVNPPNNPQNPTGQQFVSNAMSSPSIASIMKQELLKPTSSNVRQSLFDMFTSNNKATVNDGIVIGSSKEIDLASNQDQPTSEPVNNMGMLPSSETLRESGGPVSSTVNFGSPLKTMSIMEALKSKLGQPYRHDTQQATNSQSMTDKSFMVLCDTVASTSCCIPANPLVRSQLTPSSFPASLSNITSSHSLSSLTENHELNNDNMLDGTIKVEGEGYALQTENGNLKPSFDALDVDYDENAAETSKSTHLKDPDCVENTRKLSNGNDERIINKGTNIAETDDSKSSIDTNILSNRSDINGDGVETINNAGKGYEIDMNTCELDLGTEFLKTEVFENDTQIGRSNREAIVSPGRVSLSDIIQQVKNKKQTEGMIKNRVFREYKTGTEIGPKSICTDEREKSQCKRKEKILREKNVPKKKNVYVITIPHSIIKPAEGSIERLEGQFLQSDNLDEELRYGERLVSLLPWATDHKKTGDMDIDKDTIRSPSKSSKTKYRPLEASQTKDRQFGMPGASQTKYRTLGKVHYDCGPMLPSMYGSHSEYNIYEETKVPTQSSVKPSKSAPELTVESTRLQKSLMEVKNGDKVIDDGVDIEQNLNELRVKHKLTRVTNDPVRTYQLSAKSKTEDGPNSPRNLSFNDLQVNQVNIKQEESWKVGSVKSRKYKKQPKSQQVNYQSYKGSSKVQKYWEACNRHQSRSCYEEGLNSSLTCDEDFFTADVLSNLFPANLGCGDSDTENVFGNIEHELFDLQDAQPDLGQQQNILASGLPEQTYSYPYVQASPGLKSSNTIGHCELPTQWTRQIVGQTMQLASSKPRNSADQTQLVLINNHSPQLEGKKTIIMNTQSRPQDHRQTLITNKQTPQVIHLQNISPLQTSQSSEPSLNYSPGVSTQPSGCSSSVFVRGDNGKVIYINLSGTSGQPTVLTDDTNVVKARLEAAVSVDTEVNSFGWNNQSDIMTTIKKEDPAS